MAKLGRDAGDQIFQAMNTKPNLQDEQGRNMIINALDEMQKKLNLEPGWTISVVEEMLDSAESEKYNPKCNKRRGNQHQC